MKWNIHSKKTGVLCMLVFFFAFVSNVRAQDSTSVAKHSARDFGLMFGGSLTSLTVESEGYFNAATQQLVDAKGTNNGGLTIGLFYNIAITPKWMIRPSVEAHLCNTAVKYTIGNNRESYAIFPVCVEVPISVVYGINQRMNIEQSGFKGLGVLAAVRPVIPVSLFNSSYPQAQPFALNAEIGLSLPKALRKTIMRTELIASYNVLSLIGTGEATDFRTNMISDMRRHFIGLRFFFN